MLHDMDDIVRFNRELALETERRTLDEAVVRRGVQRVLQDERRGRYLLARQDLRTVGQLLLTFEWSDWRDGWFWWIQSVYVARDARRQGVYSVLYDYVLLLAERSGDVCGVRLYVDADNAAAQRAYESLGMRATHYRLYETDWSGAPGRSADPAAPRA